MVADDKKETDPLLEKKTIHERVTNAVTAVADRIRLSPKQTVGLGLFGVLVIAGALTLHLFMGLSWLTATYVVFQIITTVGYGDFTVEGHTAKFVMGIYCFLMLFVMSFVLNIIIDYIQTKANDRIREKLREAEISANEDISTPEQAAAKHSARNKLISSGGLFLAFLTFGAVFYRLYEPCTCSYGQSHVDGCIEYPVEKCMETGGYVKSWQESWYMSIVTLSTIGFGDHTPRSRLGRIVGCFWMLFGCASMTNLLGAMADFISANEHKIPGLSINMSEVTNMRKNDFDNIDKDGDGTLRRSEFLEYCLTHFNIVPKDTIDVINNIFDILDKNSAADGPNKVSFETIQKMSQKTPTKDLEAT